MTKLTRFALFIGVLVLAFVVIGGSFAVWNRQRLNTRIEEIRRAGDPVSIAQTYSSAVRPGDNAASHLVGLIDKMNDLYNRVGADLDVVGFDWKNGVEDLTLAKLTKDFDAHADLAAAHQKASRSEYLHWPSDKVETPLQFQAELLDHLGDFRMTARYNRLYLRFLAAQGDYDLAAQACVDQLRLCRLNDAVPTLVGFLMNIACRNSVLEDLNGILQSAELTETSYAVIEDELAVQDTMENFVHALKTERAFGIASFDSFPIKLTGQTDHYLDVMDQQIAIAAVPHYLAVNQKLTPGSGLTQLLLPAIQQAREARDRNITIIRCLRVLNAVQSKPRIDGSKRFSIGSLELPKDAISDPYTGNGLTMKSTERGWIVYACGPNSVDDGGSVGDGSDIGVAPPGTAD